MKIFLGFILVFLTTKSMADITDEEVVGALAGGAIDEKLKTSSNKILKNTGKIGGGSGIINAFVAAKEKMKQEKLEHDMKMSRQNANHMLTSFIVFEREYNDKKIQHANNFEIDLLFNNNGLVKKDDNIFSSLITSIHQENSLLRGNINILNKIYKINKEDHVNELTRSLIYNFYNSCHDIHITQLGKLGSTMYDSPELSLANKYCGKTSSVNGWSFGPTKKETGIFFMPDDYQAINLASKNFTVSRGMKDNVINFIIKVQVK